MKRPFTQVDAARVIVLLAIGIIIVVILCVFLRGYKSQETVKPIFDTSKVIYIPCDSIPVLDMNILKSLEPVLKKREGLSLKPYKDSKGFWYVGYGHMITHTCCSDNGVLIDSASAEYFLKQDIRNAYFENARLNRKTLYQNIFNIFISGKR